MATFDLSPYGVQAGELEHRRLMAQLLSKQGAEPLQTNRTAGGFVVPISPFEGLAKVLQSHLGAYGQRRAGEELKALSDKSRAEGIADIDSLVKAIQGTPARELQTTGEPGNDFIPEQAAVPGDKRKALAIALQSQNPLVMGAGQAILADVLKGPDSLFSKIDPKDYTPESVRAYAVTKDPSVLRPVRKMESVNTGGTTQFVNPYEPPSQPIQHTQTPDSIARIAQAEKHWEGLSAQQRLAAQFDAAKLGVSLQELLISRANAANTGLNTQFNTGSGVVPGMPALPSIPQVPGPQVGNAPVQQSPMQTSPVSAGPQVGPRAATPRTNVYAGATGNIPPGAADGAVTPKAKAEIAAELYKKQVGANQILKAINFDPVKQTDDISSLIPQSTSGMVQNALASSYGAVTGSGTSGKKAIGRLETAAHTLTMDLMGGKLGAGISNADRDFIVSQLGDIANPNIPSNVRLAAWRDVVARLQRMTGAQTGGASGSFGNDIMNRDDAILKGKP